MRKEQGIKRGRKKGEGDGGKLSIKSRHKKWQLSHLILTSLVNESNESLKDRCQTLSSETH